VKWALPFTTVNFTGHSGAGWIDLIFFLGFHLPAIASSSEAGGDEAEKTQFRFREKKWPKSQ
jgi:hypothetical protein